jgi:hydroxymethylbilane synthase
VYRKISRSRRFSSADPRDVLVSRAGSLVELPAGARIGTSSLRRVSLIRALRPDVETLDLRGNVDTRLRKLDAGDYDAIVLAGAGLARLGLTSGVTEWLPVDSFLPSPGQGALAIEVRADDGEAAPGSSTRACGDRSGPRGRAGVPRAARCRARPPLARTPASAEATPELRAMIGAPDGRSVRGEAADTIGRAAELGESLAERLLATGGRALVDESERGSVV